MQRRRFIQLCGLSALGVSGAAILSGCKQETVRATAAEVKGNELSIDRDQLSAETPYVMVQHPHEDFPICVVQKSAVDFTASLMKCTHLKCTVAVKDAGFVCPCHGARFTFDGEVIDGPAQVNLVTYPVRVEGAQLVITLS